MCGQCLSFSVMALLLSAADIERYPTMMIEEQVKRLKDRNLKVKVIVSVDETANLKQVAEQICDQLGEYGATVDGFMSSLQMFVVRLDGPKPLDEEALKIIDGYDGVKNCEIDSIVSIASS
eukprot:Protomagalhaensia_wolfi_Nauph_80__3185@NODE_3240_length_846_cov_783_192069_g2537_i0_p1_GENE_NODE_3240_length_846_cov_783_192069_g2537_i0NODE_3240_length_846_cov_783_192069_g2537_i0_p1_ORF_typecomplete_len121_score31_28_NODE_3240_length_846_cov_783_192069_g2537_i0319681